MELLADVAFLAGAAAALPAFGDRRLPAAVDNGDDTIAPGMFPTAATATALIGHRRRCV
jgi:hypothetical protein